MHGHTIDRWYNSNTNISLSVDYSRHSYSPNGFRKLIGLIQLLIANLVPVLRSFHCYESSSRKKFYLSIYDRGFLNFMVIDVGMRLRGSKNYDRLAQVPRYGPPARRLPRCDWSNRYIFEIRLVQQPVALEASKWRMTVRKYLRPYTFNTHRP